MKKLITFLSITTTVAILALPVAARNLIAQPNNAFQDAACTDDAKTALYQSIRNNLKADQAKAYEDAKKYLACPATGEVTEAQQKIIDYLKNFVSKYEEASRKTSYRDLLYNKQKYAEAYAAGKEILATEPENLQVLVDLGTNAYLLPPLKNPSLTAEGLGYAQKALAMLDSGKTLEKWDPLGSKDVAVAYLNYSIGTLTLEKDPGNALKNLIKAAQFETPLKKSPYTYAYIAGAYETGSYAKLSDEYKTCCSGKDETPDSKLKLANINQIVDRMIDAYARAVALAASDPKFAQAKTGWNESLTTWYKYRNSDKTDGLDQMVAGVLSKPLPPEPTPLTSLPATTPAVSTPAGTSAAPAGNGTGNGATTSTPAGAKPAGTPKPDKPRNRFH
jgi:tetratricopeptide (TPR) repeat protein